MICNQSIPIRFAFSRSIIPFVVPSLIYIPISSFKILSNSWSSIISNTSFHNNHSPVHFILFISFKFIYSTTLFDIGAKNFFINSLHSSISSLLNLTQASVSNICAYKLILFSSKLYFFLFHPSFYPFPLLYDLSLSQLRTAVSLHTIVWNNCYEEIM